MRAVLPLLVFATLGCDRGHPKSNETPAPPLLPVAVAKTCSLAPIALKLPMPKRAVAIGDLHGDFDAARAALRTAGAIADDDKWIGKDLTIIQTGDVLDRGEGESKILELLERLDTEARAQGGAVIQLIGNHELMNAAHDFRYVTEGGAKDFDGDRQHELAPGGTWAKRIAHHNVIAIVGDTVLSHAGVTAEWVSHLDEVNEHARCWLDGQEGGADNPTQALTSDNSPVWTRVWGGPQVDCAALASVLQKLGAKRMVVAHTPQPDGISSQCDGALWRIDIGLSKRYGGPIEVLELGDPPKVLKGTR
ncbi:MAG TPA: metallophosphoesterase [Kofleriaceae bacterium]